MNKDDDPWEILGVSKDASEAEIKKAFRKGALLHHPDRQKTEEDRQEAQHVFAKFSAAYDTLTDPVKLYDWRLAHENSVQKELQQKQKEAAMKPRESTTSREPKRKSAFVSAPQGVDLSQSSRSHVPAVRKSPPGTTSSSKSVSGRESVRGKTSGGRSVASEHVRAKSQPQRRMTTDGISSASDHVKPQSRSSIRRVFHLFGRSNISQSVVHGSPTPSTKAAPKPVQKVPSHVPVGPAPKLKNRTQSLPAPTNRMQPSSNGSKGGTVASSKGKLFPVPRKGTIGSGHRQSLNGTSAGISLPRVTGPTKSSTVQKGSPVKSPVRAPPLSPKKSVVIHFHHARIPPPPEAKLPKRSGSQPPSTRTQSQTRRAPPEMASPTRPNP